MMCIAVPIRSSPSRCGRRAPATRVPLLPLLIALSATAGCSDSTGPLEILDVSLEPSDTLLITGESATFGALAEYEWGVYPADSVSWSVSDIGVLRIIGVEDARATVSADASGEAFIIATLGQFTDSARVIAVEPGDVRWRAEGIGAATFSGPALDDQGRIYTVQPGDFPGRLSLTLPDGQPAFSVSACWADLSGSVLPDGTAFTNGSQCVRRHAPDGATEWLVACGSSYAGTAVASDGSVVCLDNDPVPANRPVLVRISPEGTEAWRVALGEEWDVESRSAPAIAANGDIYVPWNEVAYGVNWLSRVTSDGTLRWTVSSPGHVDWASPALTGDRIVLTYEHRGVAVFDTTGALVWERTWSTQGNVSSPVIDAEGNIYVQSYSGVWSFTAEGGRRWSADSLGSLSSSGSSAPTLLAGDELLATCRDPEQGGGALCAVNRDNGALFWRRRLGAWVRGSPAVAPDGTIYVSVVAEAGSSDYDLLALWHRTPPLTEGWPTEGGGMGRLRGR